MPQLRELLVSLAEQADGVVVIDNASDEPVTLDTIGCDVVNRWTQVCVVNDPEQPPNLYRLWNVGLDVVREWCAPHDAWDVGIFNDDAVVPHRWWNAVSDALRSGPYAAASSDPYGRLGGGVAGSGALIKTTPDGDLMTRMCPWAFVTRGELGLRADEHFRWWWGDTDFDWRCRQSGGVVIVSGYLVSNSLANSTTVGVLAEQAGRDGETFAVKWGRRPW